MLTLARARGISVFDDDAIGVVSMPMTVIAGWPTAAAPPTRSRSPTPSSRPDSARTRSGGIVDLGRGAFVQTVDGDVAVIVVQAGQQPHQHAHGVGHHAPHIPECRP